MPDSPLEPLITECPGCRTRFRVSEAQLAMAGGRVRCGACLTVFVATEKLVFASMPTEPQSPAETDLDRLLEELSQPDPHAGLRHVARDTPSDGEPSIPKRAIAAVPPGSHRAGLVEGRRGAQSLNRLEPSHANLGTRSGIADVPASSGRRTSPPNVSRPRGGLIGEHEDASRDNRGEAGRGGSGTAIPTAVKGADARPAENTVARSMSAATDSNADHFLSDADADADADTDSDIGSGNDSDLSGSEAASVAAPESASPVGRETPSGSDAVGAVGRVLESGIADDSSQGRDSAIVETIELTLPRTGVESVGDAVVRTASDTHGLGDEAFAQREPSVDSAAAEYSRTPSVPESPCPEIVDAVCVPDSFGDAPTAESVSVLDSRVESVRVPDSAPNARVRSNEGVRDPAGSTPLVLALNEDKPVERPRRRGWLVLGVIAAVAALGVQVMWFQFDTWSRDLRWRPIYEEICTRVGCRLPVMRALEAVASRNLVVRTHPDVPGALLVDALIVNEAPFAQPFPVIELRFSSMDGRLVAGRRFKPSEYLGGELRGAEMIQPRTPVHIALEIDDPGAEAVNYVMVFR